MSDQPAPVPARTCPECGEWLPHSCAADVTITRARFTGKRVLQITDRAGPQPEAEAG